MEPFISEISPNNYYFTFKENLEKDTVYTVKTIITVRKRPNQYRIMDI